MEPREPSVLGASGTVVLPEPPPVARPIVARPREDGNEVFVAGFWRRVAAGLIDAIVVLPFAVGVIWVASLATGLSWSALRQSSIDIWLDLLLAGDPGLLGGAGLGAAVLLMYLLVFGALAGRTLGARLLGMRVIDLYGQVPTVWRAGLRALGTLLALALGGLGILWIGFDREKRGLADWLAGTYVIVPRPRSRT